MLLAFIAAIASCWVMIVPPMAGPDEPEHVVRSAALIRNAAGSQSPSTPAVRYELPASVSWPNPACFAFRPDVAADCALGTERPDGVTMLPTRQFDDPVWGHLLPGIGTLITGPAGIWVSRLLAAAIPILLVGAALSASARADGLAASSLMLALTPMSWFMFSVVNPSGLSIAGGVALWVGASNVAGAGTRADRWLAAAGWTALVLPRRDGLVWAALVLVAVLVAERCSLADCLRRLGRGPTVLVATATVAAQVWSATLDTPVDRAAILVPLLLGAFELARRSVPVGVGMPLRSVVVGAGLAGSAVALVSLRGIPSAALARTAATHTADQVNESLGVLGWLDTPIPAGAALVWCVGFGMLIAAALHGPSWRRGLVAAGVGATAISAPWLIELVRDGTLVRWQGRYDLPLLIGMPILLGRVSVPERFKRRIAVAIAMMAVVVWNLAFWAAARRWAVGVSGSLRVWEWDTYGAALPPVALGLAHIGLCVGLLTVVFGWTPPVRFRLPSWDLGDLGTTRPRGAPARR